MAGGAARPPRPSPLAGAVPLCPRARRSPLPRRACRGGRGGGDRGGGGGGGGMRYGWPAARPGIRPAAGLGPGLACSLSIAIESVQPCSRSDSLHNMQNMHTICRIYHEICGICNKICTVTCRICNTICKIICRILTVSDRSIFCIFDIYMQNM